MKLAILTSLAVLLAATTAKAEVLAAVPPPAVGDLGGVASSPEPLDAFPRAADRAVPALGNAELLGAYASCWRARHWSRSLEAVFDDDVADACGELQAEVAARMNTAAAMRQTSPADVATINDAAARLQHVR
jgi:hypothetical protein